MHIRPILSALTRHKTAATLIVLEIALSCAIVSNAVFLIGSRIQHMHRESGIVENELALLVMMSLQPDRNPDAMRKEQIATLQAVSGVKSVSSINQIPNWTNTQTTGINLSPDQNEPTRNAFQYMDDGNLFSTLGLRVVEGRAFAPEEYATYSRGESASISAVIITRTLSQHLFHGQSALGKNLYLGDTPTPIVGVIEDLLGPGTNRGPEQDYDSIVVPLYRPTGIYALRVDPTRRDEVLKAAVDALNRADPNLLFFKQDTLVNMRKDFYSRDRAVVCLLTAVSIALLAVTALGIVGLASFWVQQRTKQIGVRRALGATRGQILRYFQTENFLLTTGGIVLGLLLAFGINQLLMRFYELPRLPWYYLPLGALILWTLGQLAVLMPARRAAKVPPAIATRSA
jgi:putative ABC transport system permease protein